MAIEFNCPYCTATIRVADAYAGKQGRCPKCDTKLLIPSVPLPNQPAAPQLPVIQTQPSPANGAGPLAPNGLPVITNGNVAAPDDPFAVRPATTSVVKSRRRSARRRPSRTLVIGVPVICFLILFGVIAYSLTGSLPKLQGDVAGRRLEGLSLPKALIPWSDIGLSAGDRTILQEALTTQPESLASQVMACRLSASEDGILVTLAAQPESQWIVVDMAAEKPLAIWRRKEGPHLNRLRLDELQAAITKYAKDKLLKINGEHIAVDAVAVRDKIALNASCHALGYAIHAVADATLFPCAAEDEQGQLYFCLPKTVQRFKIQGRTLANGTVGFAGDYNVTISGEIVTTESKPAADDTKPETSMPGDESEKADEAPEMSDPDAEMKDAEPMKEMSPDEKSMPEKTMMKAE
ncbi:MAG: hypothetical protein H7Z17_17890 [Fuerstia sp.]|nr:hypothetical protein [Fuerstiella sp.]